MDTILHPDSLPFAVSLLVGVGLSAIQVASTLMGVGHDAMGGKDVGFGKDVGLGKDVGVHKNMEFGKDVDPDAGGHDVGEGVLGTLLSAMGFGRAPFIVVLMLFAAAFGVAGIAIQAACDAAFGAPAPWYVAVVPALLASMPVTGGLARGFARLVPREESYVLSRDSLSGRPGRIVVGTAASGHPAEARIVDANGHRQIVMVEPLEGSPDLAEGTHIVLVRARGPVFEAVVDPAA